MKKLVYTMFVMAIIILAFSSLSFPAEPVKLLRVGVYGEPIRDWDAERHFGHYEPELKNAIFEKLITTKTGSFELVPGLAKSWEASKDLKEITFHLQKGVRFQKGYGEVTAEDIKFSLERPLDPKWEVTVTPRSLDHVEVIDKYTVKVYFKYPDSSFLGYNIALGAGIMIMPKATEKMSVAEIRRNPIGSGPYELETWLPMEKIVLKRFKDYHGRAPYFEKIEYTVFANQETLELALKKGDIDLGIISYKAIPAFRKLQGMKIYTGPTASYAWVGMNTERKPFDDIRVRKALRYGIDVKEILEGAFERVPKRSNSMFYRGIRGYWKEAPFYEPDLEKAKNLLAEAGFARGLSATMVVSPAPRGDLVAPIVIEQLRKIGITVKSTTLTRPAQVAKLQAGKYDLYYMEYPGFARDPIEATRWFTCEQISPKGWNMAKWCNKEFDDLRMKALGTIDAQEQASSFVRMQKIMDEEVIAIWVHNGSIAIVHKDYIDLEGKVNPDGRCVLGAVSVK